MGVRAVPNHTRPPDASNTLELSSGTAGLVRVEESDGGRAGRSAYSLHLVTVDVQGRMPLRRVAAAAGWQAGDTLGLDPGDAVLRLEPGGSASAVVEVKLDGRLRAQMPYRIWAGSDFGPGTRLVVVVAPADGVAVATPVATLLGHLLGPR